MNLAKKLDAMLFTGIILVAVWYLYGLVKEKVTNPIPIIGKTLDDKYPIYGLASYLNKDNNEIYLTHNDHRIMTVLDVLTYIKPITIEDYNSKLFRCNKVVCKNMDNQVIGTNPLLYQKKEVKQ
jgi:hypothetical protein